MKKKNNPRWEVVFGFLIFVNLVYFGLASVVTAFSGGRVGYLSVVLPDFVFLVYMIIDFIAVLSYIITQHPHGEAKIISNAALIIIGSLLMVSGILTLKRFLLL